MRADVVANCGGKALPANRNVRLRLVGASLDPKCSPADIECGPRRVRLTNEAAEAVVNGTGGQILVWDTDLRGFCLRVHPQGRKVYCVRFNFQRRARLYTIGQAGKPWSADEARVKARDVLAVVAAGRDPAAEKQLTFGGPTVAALIERYLRDGPATKPLKRESSWVSDRSNLNRHALPLIGHLRVHYVRRADITRMAHAVMHGETAGLERTKARGYARVRGGLGCARRLMQTTSAMFSWAIDQELMTHNPAQRIRLPRPAPIARCLSEIEARRLLSVLSEMELSRDIHPRFSAAIRLLLFTGARKSEIMGLKWTEIDFDHRRLVLGPDRTKTGGRVGERRIPLSSAAMGVLEQIPQTSEWVFTAGRRMNGHARGLQKVWVTVRARAGIGALRVHDLRHSFASLALANKESLVLISRVLGHTSTRMTERYLHTDDTDLQGLVQRTADGLGW
jgi:integrase